MFGTVIFFISFRVLFIFQIAQYTLAMPDPQPGISNFAKKALGEGVEMAETSPFVPIQVKGAIIVGNAVVKGVDEYRQTGDIKSAGNVAAKSGLNDGVKVVNGVPGGKLAMGLAKDVVAGKNMSTIASHGGKEAMNIIPGKELASIGFSAAKAMKDGKPIEDVIKQSAQGALTQQAKDYYPMSNLDENALNLLPQTSSQASNGEIGTENAEEKSLKVPRKKSKSRKSRSTETVNSQQGNCICEPAARGLKSIRKRAANMVRRTHD